MDETSKDQPQEKRADIATRWKAGQSGNPKGRPRNAHKSIGASGAGATPTYLARVMIERPVERLGGVSGTRTRLTEYIADIFERADAGDLGCRKFVIRLVDEGDRRRLAALRNAEKAKTRRLRKLERSAAREASLTPEPPPEKAAAEVKVVSPTAPQRVQTIAVPRRAPAVEATFRRDPRTGALLGADGNALSRAEEDRLLYPEWPHISPHLKKSERDGFAGLNAGAGPDAKTETKTDSETGFITGIASPVSRSQAIDSSRNSESEKFSQKNPATEAVRKGPLH